MSSWICLGIDGGANSGTCNATRLPSFSLAVSNIGGGSGAIVSSPSGSNFDYGTTVVLTAIAPNNSTFGEWNGCPSPSGNNCTVTVQNNQSINVTFNLKPLLSNSLVSWYKLEQGSGTFFIDETGRNNGTCSGNGCPTLNPAGKVNNAYSFDGVDDGINLPKIMTLPPSNAVTVTAWVSLANCGQPVVGSYYPMVFSFGGGRLELRTNYVSCRPEFIDGGTSATSPNAINLNQWYFFTGIYNGTHLSIFVDGALKAYVPTTPISVNSNGFVIGNREGHWNGSIDEVMIFDRALNNSELQVLYNNQPFR